MSSRRDARRSSISIASVDPPAIFDPAKLDWISAQHVQRMAGGSPRGGSLPRARRSEAPDGGGRRARPDPGSRRSRSSCGPRRAGSIRSTPQVEPVFHRGGPLGEDDRAILTGAPGVATCFARLADRLDASGRRRHRRWNVLAGRRGVGRRGRKGKALFHPIRVALTGSRARARARPPLAVDHRGGPLFLPDAVPHSAIARGGDPRSDPVKRDRRRAARSSSSASTPVVEALEAGTAARSTACWSSREGGGHSLGRLLRGRPRSRRSGHATSRARFSRARPERAPSTRGSLRSCRGWRTPMPTTCALRPAAARRVCSSCSTASRTRETWAPSSGPPPRPGPTGSCSGQKRRSDLRRRSRRPRPGRWSAFRSPGSRSSAAASSG